MQVAAVEACSMPLEIFRHYRYPSDIVTGETINEFNGICSWPDLLELPVDDPDATSNPQAFRQSTIDVLLPSVQAAKEMWDIVLSEVDELITTINHGEVVKNLGIKQVVLQTPGAPATIEDIEPDLAVDPDLPVDPVLPGEVFSPWDPITLISGQLYGLSCGRCYQFSNKPLPQITTPKKIIGGTRNAVFDLKIFVNGFELTGNSRTVVSNDGAVLQTFGSDSSGISWTNTVEYDGWTWNTLTIPAGTSVSTLKIMASTINEDALIITGDDFNFPDKVSRGTRFGTPQNPQWYVHQAPGSNQFQGTLQQPVFSLGDEQAGVSLQFPTDKNWIHTTNVPQMRVITGGATTDLQANVITQPIITSGPVTYTFIFCATPVRPPDPNTAVNQHTHILGDYDANTIGLANKENVFLFGAGYQYRYGSAHPNPLPPVSESDLQTNLGKHRGWYPGGLWLYRVILYVTKLDQAHADTVVYHDGATPWLVDTPVFGGPGTVAGCHAEAKFREFHVENVRREVAENPAGVIGTYLDTGTPVWCNNPNHAHGPPAPDAFGRVIDRKWQILETRDYLREIYGIMENAGKQIIQHWHEKYVPGCSSWGHWTVPGEETYGRLLTGNDAAFGGTATWDKEWVYTDYIPLAYWRCLEREGLPSLFIHQYGRASVAEWKDSLHVGPVIGMLAVNGLNIYAGREVPNTFAAEWQVFRRGWATGGIDAADVTFWPYWRQNRFTPGGTSLLISYYEKTDGQLLVIIMNPTSALINHTVEEIGAVSIGLRQHEEWVFNGVSWTLGYTI
jgi:hypothetical protein